MLDLKRVRYETDKVAAALNRRAPGTFNAEEFKILDVKRRTAVNNLQTYTTEKNELGRKIGKAKVEGTDCTDLMNRVVVVGALIEAAAKIEQECDTALWSLMERTPNVPDADVPDGVDATSNVEIKRWASAPLGFHTADYKPRPHWIIAEELGLLDFPRAVRMSGSRFAVYKGLGAKLERALIQFMLDKQSNNGYTEVAVPLLVNAESMYGTGQMPKFESDLFKTDNGLYLIPTAEVPITNLHRGESLREDQLPIKYVGYTPCFRREAGTSGKDNHGLIRQHQFNKVELVKFTTPETSDEEHEKLIRDAESILEALELPYRRMLLSAGDMGFAAAKCYDLEVWSAGTDKWMECSSCSNFRDFQARRAGIQVIRKNGKKEFAHTINGSGLATSRVLPAILEYYEKRDGSVVIPKVLRPYMGGLEVIPAKKP